jgi:Fe-S-cluster formation regulator IscX/YfhJ
VVDGFCLVSSDSDYTRLATRIRETGIFVMGIGEKKTPKAFVNACDVFVFTENLAAEMKAARQKQAHAKKSGKKQEEKEELDPMPVLGQAFEMAVGQDGWAPLASMGQAIYQVDPSFDPRTYGHKQLSRMIAKLKDRFEIRTQELGGTSVMYVRMRE